jgi:hypothetical protein
MIVVITCSLCPCVTRKEPLVNLHVSGIQLGKFQNYKLLYLSRERFMSICKYELGKMMLYLSILWHHYYSFVHIMCTGGSFPGGKVAGA